jgi:hypothetical protein
VSKRKANGLQVFGLQLLANCKAVLKGRGFQPNFLMNRALTPRSINGLIRYYVTITGQLSTVTGQLSTAIYQVRWHRN